MGPTADNWCPYRSGRFGHRDIEAQERHLRKKVVITGKDWKDAAANQGMPRLAGSPQRLGQSHETDSPLVPPEGTSSASTLHLDFWPSEL